jgi:hypothetical protein
MQPARWVLWSVLGVALSGLVTWVERAHSGAAREAVATPSKLEQVAAFTLDANMRPPPGRFRLAQPQELRDIQLPLSRIVISHREAAPVHGITSRHDQLMYEWQRKVEYRSTRSREEALEIARHAQAELAAQPADFAAIATRYSDDPLTKDLGGALGSLPLDEIPDVILDAANQLRPGQISPIIDTGSGFQLLRLDHPPKPQRVGGRRVVIAYEGTLGWPAAPVPALPSRSEALAKARAIVSEARASPGALTEIARRHAVLYELATGNIGVWQSNDASAHTMDVWLELDVLARLDVGALSEPVDGPYGWQVFQRLEGEQARLPPLAYQAVLFRFDPKAPENGDYAGGKALALAKAALAELGHNPGRFGELQRQFCCEATVQHKPGLTAFELASLLSRVQVGEIVPEPWQQASFIGVLKRVAVEQEREVLVSAYELPRPREADLALILQQGSGAQLADATRELTRAAQSKLQLAADKDREFAALFAELAERLAPTDPGSDRMTLVGQTLAETRNLLGPELFAKFTDYMNEWVAHRLLYGR